MDVGIVVCHYSDDLKLIKVAFNGEPDTPFEGGTFEVEMKIPQNFPFKSPEMYVCTPVWHPNIDNSDGAVCMDVLDDNWTTGNSLIECVEAVRSLLNQPNPDSPLNVDAARMLRRDAQMYKGNATLWCKTFAGGSQSVPELEEKVQILGALGISDIDAVRKGARCLWSLEDIISQNNL